MEKFAIKGELYKISKRGFESTAVILETEWNHNSFIEILVKKNNCLSSYYNKKAYNYNNIS
jgi:hypothetical protein